MTDDYSFVKTDHAYNTVYNEDTGIFFRIEEGNLVGASPSSGPLAHAEDWRLLRWTHQGQNTEHGERLEHECSGLMAAAIKALGQ